MTDTANTTVHAATSHRELVEALSAREGNELSAQDQTTAYAMAGIVQRLADAVGEIRNAYAADPRLMEIEPAESRVLGPDLDEWLTEFRSLEAAWRAKVSMA